MSKMFTIAGTSKLNGVVAFRVATGKSTATRTGVLRRNGHEDIKLVMLEQPMTREQAVAWLKEQGVDAVMPSTGGKKADPNKAAKKSSKGPQHDAHVATHAEWLARKAEKAAAFVARMAAAKAAKQAA